MSKTLYLMRHGKAEQTPGLNDFDRGLIDRGMRDVRTQARAIFKDNIPDRFIVSAALRTTQTVLHMQEELDFPKDRIDFEDGLYLCSIREMLQSVNELDDLWRSVCIVGHNPSIHYLAEFLTGESIGHVATSGVVKMSFDGRWSEMGQGAAYMEFYQDTK